MSNYETIVEKCNAKIPRHAISEREGGNGRKLSYLAGFYVINRLNEVFGQGNWGYSSDAQLLHQGTLETGRGVVHSVHYLAKVRLVVTIGKLPTEFTDYGYGDGTDKTNPGKAHELAIKEAITDGLKRAGRCLGNSFGNGLYDKSGEGIDEGVKVEPPKQAAPVASPKPQVNPEKSSRETTNKLIQATSKVIIDRKVATLDELVGMVKAYGVSSKEELNDEQASKLLAQLREKNV